MIAYRAPPDPRCCPGHDLPSGRQEHQQGDDDRDVPAATAILDRFLHHAEIVTITGRSYRLKDRTGKTTGREKSNEADDPTCQEKDQ